MLPGTIPQTNWVVHPVVLVDVVHQPSQACVDIRHQHLLATAANTRGQPTGAPMTQQVEGECQAGPPHRTSDTNGTPMSASSLITATSCLNVRFGSDRAGSNCNENLVGPLERVQTESKIEIENRNDNKQGADWSLVKTCSLRFLGSHKMNELQ